MVVDGVELLRMIRDKKIKAGTKIEWGKQKLYFDGDNIVYENSKQKLLSILWDLNFANAEFEILSEEDEEIDIQSIEELDEECYFINELAYYRGTGEYEVVKQQNKIIKAIKQLDKKINK